MTPKVTAKATIRKSDTRDKVRAGGANWKALAIHTRATVARSADRPAMAAPRAMAETSNRCSIRRRYRSNSSNGRMADLL